MRSLSQVFEQFRSSGHRRRARRSSLSTLSANRKPQGRPARIEQLEQRTLLSVGPTPHDDDLFLLAPADETHDHEGVETVGATQGPIIVDFGGAGPDAPVAGMDQWLANGAAAVAADAPAAAGITGAQKVMVLRVYFNDYTATSTYDTDQMKEVFGKIDQLWQDTSYGNISLSYQVTELYKLPGDRAVYVAPGTNTVDFQKVADDAVALAPTDGFDWTNLATVAVMLAETDTDPAKEIIDVGGKADLLIPGASEPVRIGAAVLSENPMNNPTWMWGAWAHEVGHSFQQYKVWHPSNYDNPYELMDGLYPGQTGVFEKQPGMDFPGWMPETKYQVFTPFNSGKPGSGGGIANIWAMEYDPAGRPNYQAVKAELSDDLYYLVSVRRRILGDDLDPSNTPPGIPDEGVLIERVEVGADPWVTVMPPTGGTIDDLWQVGGEFVGDGLTIMVVQKLDASGDNYQVRVGYTDEFGSQPDVAMQPWISPPGNTYETTDIWIDSPVNGYDDGSLDPDAFSYGVWETFPGSGEFVPVGNGDVPAIGQPNRLYARVRNLGGKAANNVVVNWEITDPAIAGVGPDSPWTDIGSVSQADFPGLASIPGGGFVDVYVEWTPDFPIPEEDLEDGLFQLHRCIRVVIDPVAGETALGNQDGLDEQENIFTFQAVPETSPAAAGALRTTVVLQNPEAVPRDFYLSHKSDLPAAWGVEINGGDLGIRLAAKERREIPVVIQPAGPAVLGSVFKVEVTAASLRELVNQRAPRDTHMEFHSLGGVVVETRVQRRPTLTIQRADRLSDGTVRVTGKFNVQGFSTLYDPAHPFRVMVEAVDANRRFESNTMVISTVGSNGTFQAQITDPTPSSPVLEVVAMFAGTEELAGASTGYVNTVPTDFYYAYDPVSRHLVEIDAVGGQVRHVGSTGIIEPIDGLALTESGALYGHSANLGEFGGNNFYRIDRLTGAATLVGPISLIVGGGMGYDPETDSIYTTTFTGGFLVEINPSTGRGTQSGAGAAGLTSPTAAAFDTLNDRLIVFDNADDQFYSFDPATGNATLLASASPALNGLAMAYNGSNFVIADNTARTLRSANPDTGGSSLLLTPSETLNIQSLEFVDRFRQGDLLGIDWSAATLYDVDRLTGAVSNPRPTGLQQTVGIAFADDHTLYTLTNYTASSNPNSLFTLDRVSGAATLIGSTGLSQIAEADLDFDPKTGILYGVQNIPPAGQRQLFTIDATTGLATVVGSIGGGDYSAMAFDVRGNLYVLDTASDVLLTVNKSTAATLSSTALSRSLGNLAGMDFDPETGILYVVDGGSGGTDALYTLDPTTGLLTPVGRTGLASGLAGLQFVPVTGAIRGVKFNDRNGNGARDSGEEGLPNWQVFLDENNNGAIDPITTTTRPGSGGIIPDVGAIPYPLVATGLVAPVMDLNVTLNVTHPIMARLSTFLISPTGTRVDLFVPGQIGGASLVNTTFDDEATRRIAGGVPGDSASFQAEGLLSELDGEDPNGVWQLLVLDTVPDSFLGVLTGWSITFTHGEKVVTTGANGDYAFGGLKPDTYTVAEVQQAGWIQTFPWSPSSHRVTVGARQVRAGRDFGNFRPGEIRGVKYNDRNGNGARNSGEEGLPNWQIFFDENENGVLNPVTTTTRPGSGGVIPDVATIPFPLVATGLVAPIVDLNVTLNIAHPRVELLDAYLLSPMGTRVELFSPGRFGGGGITGTFDDEAAKAEGMLAAFDGEDPNGAWLLMVTDVFTDNSVGVVTGWSIQFTHGEQAVATDPNGDYVFAGLKPDTYTLAEVQQAGWIQTFPWFPSSHRVALGAGQVRTGRDFGNFRPGEIRGAKWNDLDGDGVRDAGEGGLPGWQIYLDDNDNGALNPVTTTTRPGSGGVIPDVGTIPFPLVATGLVTPIVDLNVTLNIVHPRVEMLDAFLVSPMGTRVELFSPGRFGGGGITGTFDDEAAKAEGMLAAFDGEDPNGAWLLMITDVFPDSSVGVLTGWSIQFTHGEKVVTTDANGDYVFAGLKPDTYTVAETQRPGWQQTYPNAGAPTWEVVLGSGQNVGAIDFGNHRPFNTPPAAKDDLFDVDQRTTLTIAAPGLLGNDGDADDDPLTAVKLSDPGHGQLTLSPDGSFTYQPEPDFRGVDTFTYKANDGGDDSNEATVTIFVNPVLQAPPGRGSNSLVMRENAGKLQVINNRKQMLLDQALDSLRKLTILGAANKTDTLTLWPLPDTYGHIPYWWHFDAGPGRNSDALTIKGTAAGDTFAVDTTRIVANGVPVEYLGVEKVTLGGGAGDDVYQVSGLGAKTVLTEKKGIDGLDFSQATIGVSVNLASRSAQKIFGPANLNTLTLNGTFKNVIGSPQGDIIKGNSAANWIDGRGGNDTIYGSSGNDSLYGGEGNDSLRGGSGNDLVDGGDGLDALYGESGNDLLLGGLAGDKLFAGSGKNILIGGEGEDELTGWTGEDLLIGGKTIYDDDQDALLALLAEWKSTSSFTRRVKKLSDGFTHQTLGFLRLTTADPGATVLDDLARDSLFGGNGSDWFLSFPDDDVRDRRPTDR